MLTLLQFRLLLVHRLFNDDSLSIVTQLRRLLLVLVVRGGHLVGLSVRYVVDCVLQRVLVGVESR